MRLGAIGAFAVALPGCALLFAIHDHHSVTTTTEPAPDTACPAAVSTPTAPVIFFSDLESGPTTGGENDLGVFITLYGLRFGETRGDSIVTIGGHEVARYVSWNPPTDQGNTPEDPARRMPRGLQRIVVQPGPGVVSGAVEVVVDGLPSNPLQFAVRPGRILFVDGGAAAPGDGSAITPWQHLTDLVNLRTGDTAYVKQGGASFIYTALAPASPTRTTHLHVSASAGFGSATAPIAIVGYPGDLPVWQAG